MLPIDERPFAPLAPSLRRRMGVTLSVLITVIIGLTIAVGQRAAPATGARGGAPGAPAGVLFLRNPGQAAELWIADASGGQARMLAPAVSDYSSSPDGTRIIYSTQTQAAPSRIDIVDRTTGATRAVLQSAEFAALGPVWSPASGPGVIVYERRTVLGPGSGSPKLWLMKEDGTDLGAVIRGGDVVAYGAKWSPDGSKLAFVDPLRSEIVLFNFSNQLRRLPFNGDFDWAPDSARLVVSAFPISAEGVGASQLFLYDLATESRQPLFASPDSNDSMPAWSPDGSRIAFVRRTRNDPQGTLWVGTPADGQARSLNQDAPPAEARFADTDPQWSPAGDQLIWTRLAIGVQAPPAVWRATIGAAAPPSVWIENAQQARWIK
ncbi:MAG TPA: hypothetical protein VD886_13215 [Herpetosiphonaceae bacterium]|nr:hypothetical protein [Herpetosiphonaceae bacterium]